MDNLQNNQKSDATPMGHDTLLCAGWTSVNEKQPIDDYGNQFRLLCYYPRGNDVGSNYKIVWTFNFKHEIGVSHWMVLPSPPACT